LHFVQRLDTEKAPFGCTRALAALSQQRPATDPEPQPEDRELPSLIQQGIATLPPRQKLVCQVFFANFPESSRLESLRRAVSAVTAVDESSTAVHRALHQGLTKLAALLVLHGYRCQALAA
jgi:hypothetical protein